MGAFGKFITWLFDLLREIFKSDPTPSVYSGPPRIVCGGAHSVKGFDASHHQPFIDFAKAKNDGFEWVTLKATEGLDFVDPTYASRWALLKSVGIIRGAYHFYRPSLDPIKQAEFFASVVGKHQAGDLPCAMDWEVIEPNTVGSDLANALLFLEMTEKLTGKTPSIYSNASFLEALKLTPAFAKYPLWISHWGAKCPMVPAPWQYWTYWQYAEKGPNDPGDLNVFNGTREQLLKFTV